MSIVDGSMSDGKSRVEEGGFIDVSEFAKDMGFKTPVLFSLALYEKCIAVDGVADHLNDVLMAFKFAAAKRWDGQLVLFDVLFQTSASPSFEKLSCEGKVAVDSASSNVICMCLSDETK